MKSPLEELSELEIVIRELYKMDSKLLSGQVILAHRELRKLVAALERVKAAMVKKDVTNNSLEKNLNNPNNEKDGEI